MPHKHKVKVYVKDGHYHVYNRGVEKRTIFMDQQDYEVFLYLLKYFLSTEAERDKHPLADIPNATLVRPRPLPGLSDEIDLLAYCLMPNHFHLLLKQKTNIGMSKFMRKLATTYAMYFNRRYQRVGYLFQGVYKAALITEDPHLLHVSRYIHLNPASLSRKRLTGLPARMAGTVLVNPQTYEYSSYPHYLGRKHADWLKPNFILSYFENNRNELQFNRFLSYQEFVEHNESDPKEPISAFTID